MSRLTTNEIVDWICIVMIILGSLGNSLGLIVFSSRKFRRTTYGRLAIASLIINLLCVYRYSLLLHSSTRRWITYKAGQSWFNCKLYRFSSCLRILSALVTVTWTYERFTYVTTSFHYFLNNQYIKKYKFYFMTILSLIVCAALTGPTIYFYEPKSIPLNINPTTSLQNTTISIQNTTTIINLRLLNLTTFDKYSRVNDDLQSNPMICGLKGSISPSWKSFLIDVRFGLNYTTFRSIFSEIIPSLLVIFFNIGIIIRVIQSSLTFSANNSSINLRQSHHNGSFHGKDCNDGLIVHNRPRTSWMNIVLIIHSCLFFFSSLTATIVNWSTSDALLSYGISVVILANCSLNFYVYCLSGKSFRNEIRKLFYAFFQLYCCGKFMNLFRTKQQREQVTQTIRMRLVKNRNFIARSQTNTNIRPPSFVQRYN